MLKLVPETLYSNHCFRTEARRLPCLVLSWRFLHATRGMLAHRYAGCSKSVPGIGGALHLSVRLKRQLQAHRGNAADAGL
jgi:hypothetical protein